MEALAAFSPDYATARRRFRETAARAGWTLESHRVDCPQPVEPELTIDVAITPGRDSSRAVVVSSGLHGVEGFFGSAVQLAWLEALVAHSREQPPVRCVFLHSLNPFGFACIRRPNEDNVDPNRNFLLEGEAYVGSPPQYAALNDLLNPQRPPSMWEPFTLKALLVIARMGLPALKQAIAGGQFDFPRGIFYGGAQPSRTNRILKEHLARWVKGCSEVIHLDFHTGLGPWATCKLLIDYPLTDRQRLRLTNCLGADSFEMGDPSLTSYHVRGGFDRWCITENPQQDYLHACAEFGTYGPTQVLGGLRAENQAHHWGRPADRATLRTKERLKELFCPASTEWRSRTLSIGCGLIDKALNGLTTT